jgi:hypothetical protein
MAYKINPFTTNFDYYETGTGSTVSQDLDSVLTAGNNAGANDIDMNNNDLLNVDKISFFTGTTDTGGVAQFVWNDADGTLDLGLKGGSATLQLGQENIVRVVNKTVPLINLLASNYQAVVIAGATGQRLSVKLAKADGDANSAGTLGLVVENIAANQEGFIVTVGLVKKINTTGALQGETWNDGDVLYLSPTVFGGITNIKPVAPNHLVVIGYVEYAHNVNGKIYVKVDNGYELNELHDVAYPTVPAVGEILARGTNRWENKTFSAALGYTPASAARNITVNGTTQDLSADRTFTVTDVNLSTSDVTNNNVSTLKHGFVPKAPNDSKKYLDGTGSWTSLPVEIQFACSDETTAITAGNTKMTFRMPHAMTLTSVRASLTTAQASGNIFTVDINEGGVSILSTKLTIDNTEKTSVTALTAAVISDNVLADDAEITIDVDQIGDGTATGLKVTLIGYR